MILYGLIQSPVVSKRLNVWWCSFRRSIPLFIDYVWESSIDRAIKSASFSYCKLNRYCQNHRSILPIFLYFAWIDTVEYSRLSCSNNNIYENIVFADRFRYSLTMFGVCIDMAIPIIRYRYCIWNNYIKITTGKWHDVGNDRSCRTVVKC